MNEMQVFTYQESQARTVQKDGEPWFVLKKGLFQVKETTIAHSDGHIHISKTVKVTGAGQVFFLNKLLKTEVVS